MRDTFWRLGVGSRRFVEVTYKPVGHGRVGPHDVSTSLYLRHQDSCLVFDSGFLHNADGGGEGIVYFACLADVYLEHAGCFHRAKFLSIGSS